MLPQSTSDQSIATESIEEGLDRKHLLEIQRRFLRLNNQRLQRAYSALSHYQEQFLKALPLFFHTNHPMLPGYIGQATPKGLHEYKPNKNELKLGKAFARSFRYQRDVQHAALESLFIMGSAGSVAHSRASDLDIWVCHEPNLNAREVDLLQHKCEKLTRTAKDIALECHFFLMNAADFRRGIRAGLSNEASGSTQHVLLLDEFYRTALWLGGRIPLWWLVPASREQHYQDYRHALLSKRFVPAKKVIDFGSVPGIPPEEFTGSALWQLYKAIEAPYKSVFKLVLLEAYTCAYPGFQPLSLSLKQAIYRGEIEIDELDPYIVAYRRIEHYLNKHREFNRLELVRRCLYFKINRPLSKKTQRKDAPWRWQLLEKLVKRWQWPAEKIHELDQRRVWKADKVIPERQALVTELLNSYKTLQAFKQRHQAGTEIDRDEFNILGRKLYANYERRPGKIDWVNPGISDDISEADLCFLEDKSHTWRVYPQDRSSLDRVFSNAELNNKVTQPQTFPASLKQGSLLELLLWCHCNAVLVPGTRCEFIFFERVEAGSGSAQIYGLIRALQQWLPLPLPPVAQESFKRPAIPTHLFIQVNLGYEPDSALSEKGLLHVSDIGDALGYGEFRHNLVKSIDMVSRNSWNEIDCRRFENDGANLLNNNALVLCLRTCLQTCLSAQVGQAPTLPEICVHSRNSSHADTIRYRVESLLQDVLHCYGKNDSALSARYIFSVEKGYYGCQCQAIDGGQVQARLETLNSSEAVETYLSRPQPVHAPIVFDRYAQIDDDLRLIAKVSAKRAINIILQRHSERAELTVLDEKGSLLRGTLPCYDDAILLRSLHHFLRNVIQRQTDLGGDFSANFDVFPIHFYQLQYRDNSAFLEVRHSSSDLSGLPCYPVQAKIRRDAFGNESLTVRCNGQVFCQPILGDQFFTHVKQHIAGQPYPCSITDLDLSDYRIPGLSPQHWQTSHYLRFKVDLETRLNG